MLQVLIIEDDIRVAEINRRFVEKVPGFQVAGIATDENQAKEHLDIFSPDLALLDLYFPDLNGLQFLKTMRDHHPQTDVIIITAAKELETVREAIRGGVFDFIIKPVIFERFQEKLIQYGNFRRKLNALKGTSRPVEQAEIDELLRGSASGGAKEVYLPKGIDKLTMEKISSLIDSAAGGLTAEEVGGRLGVSRSTARRYLEYFVSKGELTADVSYGTVGRPERIYKNIKK